MNVFKGYTFLNAMKTLSNKSAYVHMYNVFYFEISDLRKSLKRQKTLTNLNKSLSKTKMSRLHLEDGSTYWNQSFGKDTAISWEKYVCHFS
jgi:ATP-dependent helicase/DNAse subunit B